jgi:hypothetical protein
VLWFDHHISEEELGAPMAAFTGIKGKFGLSPSAARLIYDYYGGEATFAQYKDLVEATDRIDSAQLTIDDVLRPSGYVLLAYTVDPRSGLKDLELQMYFIMLIDWLKSKPIDEILQIPEVRLMTERLLTEDQNFREALLKHSRLDGNVVITDFRGLPTVPPGNRFTIYTLFPQANVSARLYVPDQRRQAAGRVRRRRSQRRRHRAVPQGRGGCKVSGDHRTAERGGVAAFWI